jgi:translation initiation factor 2 subunit 1
MFYKNTVPKVGSIVFIKVNNTYSIKDSDVGIYVNMIEYDNLEGLVLITELFKYKVNLQTFFKQNKVYPCVVLNNYNNKFDLSYTKVKKDSRDFLLECYDYLQRIIDIIDEYKINSIVTSIMIDQCQQQDKNLFKELYINLLINPELYITDDNVISEFKKHIITKHHEIFYDFELEVYEDNGLDLLKEILNVLTIEINNENNTNIQLYCKMNPIYSLKIKDFNRLMCANIGDKLIEKIKERYNDKLVKINKINTTDITVFSVSYNK